MRDIQVELNKVQENIKHLKEQEAKLKQELEAQNNSFEGRIINLLTKYELPRTIMGGKIIIEPSCGNGDRSGYIKLPLPNGNMNWTIEAYEWVIMFEKKCSAEGYYVYVDHDQNRKYDDHYHIYVYVYVDMF